MKKKWKLADIKVCQANRDISPHHVEKLKEIIRDKGYIEGCPIMVDSDGNIIDGQHRYEACRQLGIEPPIVECASFDLVPYLNSSQLKWGLKDYVKYHSAKGIEDFAILEQICKTKKISANVAVNCITGKCVERAGLATKRKDGYTNPIKDGSFRLPDKSPKGLAKMERKIDAILGLINDLGLPRTDRLIVAICRLAENDKFSFALMAEKIAYQRARIYRCSTIQEYTTMLANIYNNKNRNKIAV